MSEAEERFRKYWGSKTSRQVKKELDSYRKYLDRSRDYFFHESAPGSISDGQRVMILREILENNNGD